jgi:ABC-2 type transport system permease protein
VSSTVAAFGYLTRQTLRNRAAAQLQRLRSPRYVLAVAVGCAYFFLLLHRPTGTAVHVPAGIGPDRSSGVAGPGGMALLSALGLALLTGKWWLIGSANSALAFTPAEVQMLFPAPIRRRTLILYKICRSQLALLISALLITMIVRRAGSPLPPVLRVISLWVLFCTMSLHQMAAALVRAGASQRGRGLRRNVIPMLIVGGGLLVLTVTAVRAWPGARGMQDIPTALTRVWAALRNPLPTEVLWPFRVAMAPTYAQTSRAWLAVIGPALLLLALHVGWVLRADYVFEDAAVEASARRAARIAAARARAAGASVPTTSVVDKISGSMAAVRLDRTPAGAVRPRRAPFPLASTGDPAVALLWKNTVAFVRGLRLRTGISMSIVLIIFVTAIRQTGLLVSAGHGGGAVLLGTLALIAALFLIVLGPLAIRNDLRQDLLHLDMLRTYPLRGPVVVFAEIASPALVLTLAQWALLGASYVFLATAPADVGDTAASLLPVSFPSNLTMLAIAIAVLPLINTASFLVQNATALLFPDWVRLGATSMGGLEVIGQRLLAFGASLIALAILLAPPALVIGGILWLWQGDGTPTRSALLVAVASGMLVGTTEIYVAVLWLGHVFERTDATAIPPAAH